MSTSAPDLPSKTKGLFDFFREKPSIAITIIYLYSSFIGATYAKTLFDYLGVDILHFCQLEDFLALAFKQPGLLFFAYTSLLALLLLLSNTRFARGFLDWVFILTTHKRGRLAPAEEVESEATMRRRMKRFLIFLMLTVPFILAYNFGRSHSEELQSLETPGIAYHFISKDDTLPVVQLIEVTSDYFFVMNDAKSIQIIEKGQVDKVLILQE